MKDLRIKTKPPTECESFELIMIKNEPSSKQNLHRKRECSCFLDEGLYVRSGNKYSIEDKFEDLCHNRGYGFIMRRNKNTVMEVLKRINWNKYTTTTMDESYKLTKSDIIRAWEENK